MTIAVVATSLAVALGTLVGIAVVNEQASRPVAATPAADLSQFQAGNIISNAVFFNSASMTQAQIQAFLEAKVPSCQSGYTCLKDWYDTSRSTSADAMCGAYQGGTSERASAIIYKVAQACGINPQVILVTLQKEQGLVTNTWPSTWRYTIAMGQGCPDTAACNTTYYGFFNQVYGAAWQFKRYGNPPGTSAYFTWYSPGKTWNVQYNPSASCGSSPVYIQNQATADLYYYTPYQPNSAALAAGYGSGDSCSSYGNRNFFNYFTDWFGSTQSAGPLVSLGADIYVVSGGRRYHVTLADWPAYNAAFGQPASVSTTYLSQFTDSGDASRYVLNGDTSVVAYLDAGKLHRFPTCALVAAWGGSCSALTVLSSTEFGVVGSGPEMAPFGTVGSDPTVYLISNGALAPLFDMATVSYLNGGSVPYIGGLSSSVAANYSRAPLRFVPAQLIILPGDSRVWLPTSDGRLLYLPSFTVATDLGIPLSVSQVPSDRVAAFTRQTPLTQAVTCNAARYFGSQGTLYAASDVGGMSTLELDSDTCARLNMSSTPSAPIFLKTAASQDVFTLRGGGRSHVVSMPALTELAGGAPDPRIIQVTDASLATIANTGPYWLAGQLVKSPTSDRVYLWDGTAYYYLPSFDVARAFGVSTAVTTSSEVSPPATVSDLATTVMCGSTSYIAQNGQLSRTTAPSLITLASVFCNKLVFASR
ncbi:MULTISPECIES: hypothetical protein [Microbacterium]|uniref:hypothetical protein n=1 Tax=Microbacterium TaxID=33882 RepID=UPI0010F6F5C0|nr:hypothetical protein [Microbacterium sp. 4NA327F11]